MVNSSIRPDEPYGTGTRSKYKDRVLASAYHGEFTRFSLRPNDWFVRLVTAGERRAIELFLDAIGGDVGSIADIPCGTGKLFPILHARQLLPIAGDVSLEMINVAREQSSHLALPRFVCLDATALPFEARSLGTVVCLRLMHRIPLDIKRAILTEMARVSAKYLIVSFGIESRWHRVRATMRSLITGRTTIPHPLSAAGLGELLRSCGWTIDKQRDVIPFLSAERIYLLQRAI